MDLDEDQWSYYEATATRADSLMSCVGAMHVTRFLRIYGGPSACVLDLGCGTGVWLNALLANYGRVIALDYAPSRTSSVRADFRGRTNLTVISANLLDFYIPLKVDVVLLSFVLSHLRPSEACSLIEYAATSRPHGRAIAIIDHAAAAYEEKWASSTATAERTVAIRRGKFRTHYVRKRFGAVRELADTLSIPGSYIAHGHCEALTLRPMSAAK